MCIDGKCQSRKEKVRSAFVLMAEAARDMAYALQRPHAVAHFGTHVGVIPALPGIEEQLHVIIIVDVGTADVEIKQGLDRYAERVRQSADPIRELMQDALDKIRRAELGVPA